MPRVQFLPAFAIRALQQSEYRQNCAAQNRSADLLPKVAKRSIGRPNLRRIANEQYEKQEHHRISVAKAIQCPDL